MTKDEEITDVKEIRKKIGEATGKLILYIVLYVVIAAIINNLVFPFLQSVAASLPSIPYLTSHTNSTSTSASTPSIMGYAPYVLVPNNSTIGNKIYLLSKQAQQEKKS